MKKILFLLSITFILGFETKLPLKLTPSINSNNSINSMIGIRVQFQFEELDDPNTTGDGHFLMNVVDEVEDRCNGYIGDRL